MTNFRVHFAPLGLCKQRKIHILTPRRHSDQSRISKIKSNWNAKGTSVESYSFSHYVQIFHIVQKHLKLSLSIKLAHHKHTSVEHISHSGGRTCDRLWPSGNYSNCAVPQQISQFVGVVHPDRHNLLHLPRTPLQTTHHADAHP